VKSGVPIVPVGIIGTAQLKGKWVVPAKTEITFNIGQPFTYRPVRRNQLKRWSTRMTRDIMLHIAAQLPEDYRGSYTI